MHKWASAVHKWAGNRESACVCASRSALLLFTSFAVLRESTVCFAALFASGADVHKSIRWSKPQPDTDLTSYTRTIIGHSLGSIEERRPATGSPVKTSHRLLDTHTFAQQPHWRQWSGSSRMAYSKHHEARETGTYLEVRAE